MEVSDRLIALWGKSNAGGQPLSLLQHLLDAAAVAERLWHDFLPRSVRDPLDEVTGGHGLGLYRLLAGWHDLGKATPGFQGKVPALGARLHPLGLSTRRETAGAKWRHELASAAIVREVLLEHWPDEHVDWLWPLLAGHHGRVLGIGALRPHPSWLRGDPAWRDVQRELALHVLSELKGLPPVPRARPTRSRQLALAGFLVMADWIASDSAAFPGTPEPPSIRRAQARAEGVLPRLGMRRGLTPLLGADADQLSRRRFGFPPRPLQRLAVDVALGAPGLIVIEAPMGEGKTEAALLAAEVLARHGGQEGAFLGLPTQATSDPMFTRVRQWVSTFPDPPAVGLLHGKRMLNQEWQRAWRTTTFAGVDEYGIVDPYQAQPAPAEQVRDWFLGPKRGLLQPVAVGTVDNVLQAATRTRYVMLRHAGMSAGVLILDEVHAYDVYMSQFLHEALRWAGAAAVPVVLLSATLPPETRQELVNAYGQGRHPDQPAVHVGTSPGYPAVLSASDTVHWSTCPAWRPSRRVRVTVHPESAEDDADLTLAERMASRLTAGGCVLIIRNTVARAQRTYEVLRDRYPGDAVLLHARLVTRARADRAEQVLEALGPEGSSRPRRMVVVATQVAEQSFDIDADLVVSDLAPIDLLLQRCGRLHRHERPQQQRPLPLREPELVVTGFAPGPDGPWLPPGSVAVYGERLLLRSARLVLDVPGEGWDVPAQVPALVASGYAGGDDDLPTAWLERADRARARELVDAQRRRAAAAAFLLSGPAELHRTSLEGLHRLDVADVADEQVRALVRDGEESTEVTLVRRDERGYLSLSGMGLGPHGDAVLTSDRVLDEVIGSQVRLPATPRARSLNALARTELRPLPGWTTQPYLRHARALVLDIRGQTRLGDWRIAYDDELGLSVERLA